MSKLTIDQQLLLAVTVATRSHKGQVRKDGTDYISHPVRVAVRCETKKEKIVALLHDVVEDTDVTLDELRELGFDKEIIDAIDAITKRPGERYADFILRCKANPLARKVKLADIDDNMEDQSALDPDEAEFLSNRYTKAKEVLNG
jgi:GTP diphosphokinase / guanosine-3',5'-bis(diphosphate) 3'-diphosphatase